MEVLLAVLLAVMFVVLTVLPSPADSDVGRAHRCRSQCCLLVLVVSAVCHAIHCPHLLSVLPAVALLLCYVTASIQSQLLCYVGVID
jgi:hypothetical protein